MSDGVQRRGLNRFFCLGAPGRGPRLARPLSTRLGDCIMESWSDFDVSPGKRLRVRQLLLPEDDPDREDARDTSDEDAMDSMFFAGSWTLAGATGNKTWDSAAVLVRHLQREPVLVRGRGVVELGSGCGLVGLAAACLGASSVVLTDLEATLEWATMPNAAANVAVCAPCTVRCVALDWTDAAARDAVPLPDADVVILCSDCVWLSELVEPFCDTLAALLARCGGATALVAQLERSTETSVAFASTPQLLEHMRRRGLHVELVGGGGADKGTTEIFSVAYF